MAKRRKRSRDTEDNGFAEWGGYMEAKKTKLQEQFLIDASKETSSNSSTIFNGIAIFVNGYSVPSADELKLLMMKHGGVYHHYFRSDKTTHIIATNLPDTKVKQLKNMNIVKPDWIVDSIAAGKLLDYRQYLLYSHQSKTQPKLAFKNVFEAPTSSSTVVKPMAEKESQDGNCSENQNHRPLEVNAGKNNLDSKPEAVSKAISLPSTSKSSLASIKTASEAGFLSEFYSNSRLHHISTMGAMFKQYVNELRERSTGSFPGVEKLKNLNPALLQSNNAKRYSNVIMHIDMDCFFVSVGLRKRPDLKEFPVAVTHARGEKTWAPRSGVDRKAEFELYKTRREEKVKNKNQPLQNSDEKPWSNWVDAIDETNSMSEIASCNYEARKMGLKNGMFLGQALKLCPSLKTIPYDFDGYKEVSFCLYDTVASYTLDIEAVSCDEMLVDCTSLLNETGLTPLQFASIIRNEIKEKTGCPCSTGFGANRLQARLATRRAKPDGQFHLEPALVEEFMEGISVSDLPGVGRSTSYKLSTMGIKTCSDLQQIPLTKLQSEFGVKSGDLLYKHCRGEDPKKLVFEQVRKSVSAEVNYGIRFQNEKEVDKFLRELSTEVHNRLMEVNMKTKLVTLKIMTRAADAPVETAKFLGHGVCDHISRSSPLASATGDLETISREVLGLSRQIKAEPSELRGIGIQLSKLESARPHKPSGSAIDRFLRPKGEIQQTTESCKPRSNKPIKTSNSQEATTSSIDDFFSEKKHATNQNKEKSKVSNSVKPAEIDIEVLKALPEEIRKEIMLEYGLTTSYVEKYENLMAESKEVENVLEEPKFVSEDESSSDKINYAINYSQIDFQVLNELPLEIKKEIESTMPRKKLEKVPVSQEGKISPVVEVSGNEAKLDQSLSAREVRSLITAWTAAEESPQLCDVAMLTDYLQGLVSARRLDCLDVCVCCLHRCIEKRRSKEWQETYFKMIDKLQRVMVAEYGLKLRVPDTFRIV